MILSVVVQPVITANAMTVYESDGIYHKEGYIFVGESHSVGSAYAAAANAEALREDISYMYRLDSSKEITERGKDNTFTMKGNLFFVFEGNSNANGSLQTSCGYIYSDGAGKRGRAVEKLHEIIGKNPNISHWNIISMQGAAAAGEGTKEVAQYYVNSYQNWIEYEFPQADCYFLSIATMTKYYDAVPDKDIFNNTLAAAFPDNFFDYTDFYTARNPQKLVDEIHWDFDTYFELVTDVIERIARKRQAEKSMTATEAQYSVTDVQAVFYTNDKTVIYARPSTESAVILPFCGAGLPIQVTGITSDGYFRVCVSPDKADSFIAGDGLSQQP